MRLGNKVVVLALFLSSASAMANDSGCGLGSMIIQKNSKLLQLFSLTTNSVFFNQGFGITSGTSGCSASGLVQTDREVQYFVELNNDDLSRQMARGEGEKLQVLAQLNGCDNSQGQKAFFEMTKKSYSQIYPTAEEKAQDVIVRIKSEMKNNTEVQRTCHIASI
jgi:hypothetical protein